MTLVIVIKVNFKNEVLFFDDDPHFGRQVEESEVRCVIVHYFQTEGQGYFGTVGVSGGVLARDFETIGGSQAGKDFEILV